MSGRRILVALLACWLGGCALHTAGPAPVPHAETIPHLGLNGFYHAEIDPEVGVKLCGYQRPLTVRVAVLSFEQAWSVLERAATCHTLSIVLLVEQADLGLVAALSALGNPPALVGIELGNELDLAGLTPAQFGAFVRAGYQQLRVAGFAGDIISGGLYTVDDDSLAYLQSAIVATTWPQDIVLGLHWYGDSGDDWIGKVQAFGRAVAVTEFGQPSIDFAMTFPLPAPKGRTDGDQVVYLQTQLAAFRRLGARYALIYKDTSGRTRSDLDNFGLMRYDQTWKPAADAIFSR